MKIEFSALSILSTVLVLCLYSFGGLLSIDSLSIDVNVSDGELLIGVHPIIRIDVDSDVIANVVGRDSLGFSFGNVIAIYSDIPNDYYRKLILEHERELILEHERNHSNQWRGMGIIMPLIGGFFNTEGQDGNPHTDWWLSIEYRNRTMWTPPSWWPFRWSFCTITIAM